MSHKKLDADLREKCGRFKVFLTSSSDGLISEDIHDSAVTLLLMKKIFEKPLFGEAKFDEPNYNIDTNGLRRSKRNRFC
ncbi:hypothetical protein MHBO_003333 [Bonamia ostreae]|uniref:Uncharacterized protein n=1 Tax=Bonamia ostreae TaxID=126728 RepID=A0ABV2AQ53_9EUKA